MATTLVRYDFDLKNKDLLDVKIVMPKDNRGVIHGVILDSEGKPVEDAVVELFEAEDKNFDNHKSSKLLPVTHAFTDESGQFLFGPLCPKTAYTIKVWFNAIKCKFDKFYAYPDEEYLSQCDCERKDEEHDRDDDDDDDEQEHSDDEHDDDSWDHISDDEHDNNWNYPESSRDLRQYGEAVELSFNES